MNPEYDAAVGEIDSIEKALEKELKRAQVELGTNKVSFYHPNNSKEKYQLQVPAAFLADVPRSWVVKSQTKACTRYWTGEIERIQKPLAEAEETKNQILRDMLRTTLMSFDKFSEKWNLVVAVLAEVDCLLSLLAVKCGMNEPICRPNFVDEAGVFDVKHLRHPCLISAG